MKNYYQILFIDALIIIATQLVFIVIFSANGHEAREAATFSRGIAFLAGLIYFPVWESGDRQATLGKQALGLIVVDGQGQRITWVNALGRYFAHYLSVLTFLIGYLIQPFTARKKALHDLVSDTLGLKKPTI